MRTSFGRLGLALTVATGLAAAGGCAEDDEPVDSHPILVERTAGAFVAPVRVDGEAARVAVIDVLSPLTVLDQDAALAPARRTVDLDLLAPRSATDLTQIVRGPSFSRSRAARMARPMRRWISCERPSIFPRVLSRDFR